MFLDCLPRSTAGQAVATLLAMTKYLVSIFSRMSQSSNPVILRFDTVSFSFGEDKKKVILDEADFSIRQNTKITVMGQNGA